MISNPHAGTDLEAPWEQGFAAGFLAADQDLSPPSPLTPDAQAAYAEGVDAGRFSINGMLGIAVPATPPPPEVGTWESVFEFGAEHVATHVALEVAKHGASKVLSVERAAAAASSFKLAGGLIFVISVAVFGPDRSEPFFDEAAARALERVAQQIAAGGVVSDNQELFLAACDRDDHNLGDEDEFLRQGFWHGRVFLDFDSANQEALDHAHPGNMVVFRFQTASPGVVEMIDLPS
jgi:hypothetical protein